MKHFLFYTVLFLTLTTRVLGQLGTPDPAFGNGSGIYSYIPFSTWHSQATSVTVGDDGKMIVCGETWEPQTDSNRAVIIRLRPDGVPDPSFNSIGKILLKANAYLYTGGSVIHPDGRITVLVCYDGNENDSIALYRFLPSGQPDSTFGVHGISIFDDGADYVYPKSLLLQPDGKIVFAGTMRFGDVAFDNFFVGRAMPDGKRDPGFGENGLAFVRVGESFGRPGKLLLQPDGKLILTGQGVFGGYDEFCALRMLSNGTPDLSFGVNGIAHAGLFDVDIDGNTGALQTDGKILVGGTALISGDNNMAAVRFLSTGAIDLSFGQNGLALCSVTPNVDGARSMVIQPDGKILMAGYGRLSATQDYDMAFCRLNLNGQPDSTFLDNGGYLFPLSTAEYDLANSICLQPDGKILVCGRYFPNNVPYSRMAVVRFLSDITVRTNEMETPVTSVALFPNPMQQAASLNFSVEQKENISISLKTIDGKKILSILPGTSFEAGDHHEKIQIPSSIPPGNYIMTLEGAGWIKAIHTVIVPS